MLNSTGAEYLLIGGYAVNYYGYSRSTGDMDIWIGLQPENGQRVAAALRNFGFTDARAEMFAEPEQVIRMGVPPLRLELLTSISGVEFADCYEKRELADVDGLSIPIIRLDDLKTNKRASGRLKDLVDLQELD